jgi:hypothetical protein
VVVRRRRLPASLEPAHAAFESLIPPLERARDALMTSVPRTRLPGRPLAESLAEFEQELRVVRSGMPAWRAPEVERVWRDASDGLDSAAALAERVRTDAIGPEGTEQLIGLIGELLAPLDAFRAAAERFRELRE